MRAFIQTIGLTVILVANAVAQDVSAEAKSIVQLGAYHLEYPFLSPDGTRLVFQGSFDGRSQLYKMKLETGETKRLHVSPGDDFHASWSPNGDEIAFVSNRDGNDEIYILDIISGVSVSVSPHPGKDGHPRWSSNGEWLVFNRTFDPTDANGREDAAILRVRKDGADLEVLMDTENIETFPSFSPDGRFVTFVDWLPTQDGKRKGDITVLDLNSGERRNLTQTSLIFYGYPYWGDSGDWIYYISFIPNKEGSFDGLEFEGQARRISPLTAQVENLAPLDGLSEVRLIPSPDEKTMYFNRTIDGRTSLFQAPIKPMKLDTR